MTVSGSFGPYAVMLSTAFHDGLFPIRIVLALSSLAASILCHLAIVLRYVALYSPLRTVLATAGVGLVSTGAAPLSPQKKNDHRLSRQVQSHLHRSPHPHQFLLSALLVFLLNSAVHPSASASSSVSTINLLILGLDPFLSAPLLYVSVSFGVAIVFLCPLFS